MDKDEELGRMWQVNDNLNKRIAELRGRIAQASTDSLAMMLENRALRKECAYLAERSILATNNLLKPVDIHEFRKYAERVKETLIDAQRDSDAQGRDRREVVTNCHG